MNDNDEDSSCCKRYWFCLTSSLFSIIIVITSMLIIYFLHKQDERDQERRRIRDEFKRKHRVANKVVDMIMKDGIVYKWIKVQKGSIGKVFKELFTDITQTLFDEY